MGQQLLVVERFRQEVVAATVERADAVDRCLLYTTDAADD
jgi:hypothetical protein